MQVTHPYLLPIALAALLIAKIKFGHVIVQHPSLSLHSNLKGLSSRWGQIVDVALLLSWLCFSIAFAEVVRVHSNDTRIVDSKDIVLITDNSGSMDDAVERLTNLSAICDDPLPVPDAVKQQIQAISTANTTYRKIDAARDAALLWVECLAGNRVSFMTFDDQVYMNWPLTTDLRLIMLELSSIGQKTGSGTNFDGPTESDGRTGALQGPVDHLLESGQSKSKVIVLVTDGGDSMTAARLEALTQSYQELGIHFYILAVGRDWGGYLTQDITNFVNAVHGRIIVVGSADELRTGLQEIYRLEASPIRVETLVYYEDVSYVFILAGTVLFGLAVFLAAPLRRKV